MEKPIIWTLQEAAWMELPKTNNVKSSIRQSMTVAFVGNVIQDGASNSIEVNVSITLWVTRKEEPPTATCTERENLTKSREFAKLVTTEFP